MDQSTAICTIEHPCTSPGVGTTQFAQTCSSDFLFGVFCGSATVAYLTVLIALIVIRSRMRTS